MDPQTYMMASGEFHDPEQALDVLKASLQALRNRLPKVKAYNLGTQLPASIRHFYFEGWHNGQRQTESVNKSEFLAEVKDYLKFKGTDEYSLEDMVPVALKAILSLIGQNDAKKVKESIPRSLHNIFQS